MGWASRESGFSSRQEQNDCLVQCPYHLCSSFNLPSSRYQQLPGVCGQSVTLPTSVHCCGARICTETFLLLPFHPFHAMHECDTYKAWQYKRVLFRVWNLWLKIPLPPPSRLRVNLFCIIWSFWIITTCQFKDVCNRKFTKLICYQEVTYFVCSMDINTVSPQWADVLWL
jgi:hypothetical protein